jgi:serine/threonine protein kinase
MAPEIVLRTEYEGPPVDIWGAGVLLYACLCGQFPFRAQSYPDLYRRIARGTFVMPEEVSTAAKDMLRLLLSVDAGIRPTAASVLKHPWLQTQLVAAPDLRRLRLDTSILISENPSDDIDTQAVTEIVRFGISREEVIRLIMTKTHSSVTTLYYLFLDALCATRTQPVTKLPLATVGMAQAVSGLLIQKKSTTDTASKKENEHPYSVQSAQASALATQFLLKSAGGAGVLNLRPRSASTSRNSSHGNRPFSANMTRR